MDAEMADYMNARTSVWWDIENCQVPRGSDTNAIARNIRSALFKANYKGRVSISAYGDTQRIPSAVQNALSSTGVSLNHVPSGVKDAADKKILVDMLLWAIDNPAPANILLISGDRDFSNALHQLSMRRYNILLARPKDASAPLVAAATNVWLWTNLVAGGRSLSKNESIKLFKDASPSCSNSPIGEEEPKDSYSTSPSKGNQELHNGGKNTKNHANQTQNGCVPKNTASPRESVDSTDSLDGISSSSGSPRPSAYVQGLIELIVQSLNTLKHEKVLPTEENIINCIRSGTPEHQNADVPTGLESAVEYQTVDKRGLGSLQLYVPKNEELWKCPMAPHQYPNSTWDAIQTFLSSRLGRSAIMGSRSRYEAATVLKSMCLEDLPLGEVFQILNMIITSKGWIVHHHSGWQPVKITLPENEPKVEATPVPPDEPYAAQRSKLQDMGFFGRGKNLQALIATRGDVRAAIELLLSDSV